jgi:uncharacterized protein YuzE
MIKTSYDPVADAMFVWLVPEGTRVADTIEVAPGIMLDYDGSGKVIGIEMLDMRRRTAEAVPLIAAE